MGHSAAKKVPLGAQQGRRRPPWSNHHGELEGGLCHVSRDSGLLAPTHPGPHDRLLRLSKPGGGESGHGGREGRPHHLPQTGALLSHESTSCQGAPCTLRRRVHCPLRRKWVVQCGCPLPSSAGQSPWWAGQAARWSVFREGPGGQAQTL